MKWSCRKRAYYWFLDYGEITFLLSILIMAAIIIVWMLVLLLTPKTASAGDITNFRTATRQAPVTLHSDMPTTRVSVPVVTILCEVSAYSPTVAETDGNPFITASGKWVYVGGIAADPKVLPLGSRVIIPNYNNGEACTVVDTGSYIKGNRLDVFLWKTEDAIHWGRRRGVKVQVLFVPKEGL